MNQTCIVADAGPLIGLARIGRLALLRSLFDVTILPPAVYAECVRAGDKPGAVAISGAVKDQWLVVRAPSEPQAQSATGGLGRGEREAIALAVELRCLILLDDKLARATNLRRAVSPYAAMSSTSSCACASRNWLRRVSWRERFVARSKGQQATSAASRYRSSVPS